MGDPRGGFLSFSNRNNKARKVKCCCCCTLTEHDAFRDRERGGGFTHNRR